MSESKALTQTTSEQDSQRWVLPAVDVYEDETGITLLADMPGVPKDRLELKVEGDALLIEGCGRTDFQNGDARALYHSVRAKLFALPDDTLVYPGHDYKERRVSSIAQEKARNPRLGGEQSLAAFEKLMAGLDLAYPKFIDFAVPGNRACGECPGGVPEALQEYCEQIGHSLQG